MQKLPYWALVPMLVSSIIGVIFLGIEFCKRYM